MNPAHLAAIGLLSLAIGCGSAPAGEPEHPHHGEHHDDHHGDHHEGHHGDHHGDHHGEGHHKGGHHETKGAMKGFHDVLAPVYHLDKTPARSDKACEAVPSMKTEASKVAAEPAGDATTWKAKSDALAQSIDGLDRACKEARAEVPAKLEVVHDAFHALMEAQKK